MQNINQRIGAKYSYPNNTINGSLTQNYTYGNVGNNFDGLHGYQSPCPSSTSSSKTRKKQKRTYYQSDNDSDVEVRKKPRHALLNESLKPENVDEVDTIEEVLDTRLGREGNTGDETTVYNVLYDTNPVKTGSERQYLIKWKNWSHVHATWESEISLKLRGPVEGMKKLENYIVAFREEERRKNGSNPDELERIIFAEEQSRDSQYQKMQIDRIIHHQYDKNNCLEYFIKWNTLEYKYVTAESSESVVEPLFPTAIHEYKENLQFLTIPDTKNDYLRRRPMFKPLPEKLSFGTESNVLYLRDYQLIGVNWLLKLWTMGRNAILADEMGLGKTIQTIAFISILFRRYKIFGPYLLIVPLSTIHNWKKEFDLWAPEVYTVVYSGDIASREVIRKYEWFQPGTKNLKFNVILTSYEIVMNDKNLLSSIYWVFVGVDEAHRLKSSESKLYKTIFPFRTNSRLLITGTPLQNNIKELWSLLHFIMPNIFDTFDTFEGHFGTGDNEQLCNDKLAGLRGTIEPYILRREKKDVEKSLPAKSEQILRINMSHKQKELYRLILAKNFDSLLAQTNKRTVFKNVIVELKKCCNHIDLISDKLATLYSISDRMEYLIKSSGKMIVLDKLLTHLKTEGHRVLIFSQMVRMLDILDIYLRLKGWGFQRLDGSISSSLRNEAIKSFNANGSTDFCFLLSTRAGGLGINLTTADTVIIFDSDWNPHADLQAMARAHRIGQTKQVSIYRFVIKSSVEEKIIERAKRKMVLDHLIIQRMEANGHTGVNPKNGKSRLEAEDFEAILRFSAQEIFRDDNCDSGNEENDFNLQTILKQAEVQEDHSNATNAFLSSFKVISLDTDAMDDEKDNNKDWNNLIPKRYIEHVNNNQGDIHSIVDNVDNSHNKVITSNINSSNKRRKDEPNISCQNNNSDSNIDVPQAIGLLNKLETRKLVTVMQKFGCPQQRADKILEETQLGHKLNSNTLAQVMVDIVERCKHASLNGCGGEDVLDCNSYQIQVKQLLSRFELLEELHAVMSVYTFTERVHHQFLIETKPTCWGCPWQAEDDNHLLVGVFEHGMSSWRSIKADMRLKLHDKILPSNPKLLPQVKHLSTRLHYLLECLKKCCKEPIKLKIKLGGGSNNTTKSSLQSTSSPAAFKPKKLKSSSKNDFNKKHSEKLTVSQSKNGISYSNEYSNINNEINNNQKYSIKPIKKEEVLSPSPSSTSLSSKSSVSNSPIRIVPNQDLDDFHDNEFVGCRGTLFKECKAYMKQCRKQLEIVQRILTTEKNKSDFKYLNGNIVQVGEQINQVVSGFENSQQSTYLIYLWQFVKIFCPNYSANELYQFYKDALNKQKM